MADTAELALLYPSAGMNGSGCSTRIPKEQYRRATNVQLVDEIPTTRPPVVIFDLPGELSGLNVQGAMFFNPAKGQDGLNTSVSRPQIVVAAGGRKFTIELDGTGLETVVTPKRISADLISDPYLHLVWWRAAENYAFAQDGMSNCFIWDSANPGTLSAGYDTEDKPSSSVPNGATCMLYAHARLGVVVNARFILFSDSLHKSNKSTAVNLLDFTEQVYWDTGQFFLPPSEMGNILCAAILPLQSTQHGQAECMFHCEDGVFSVEINVAPRSDWPTKATVRHALLQAGATGPYALSLRDGDQIYRTRHGVTTFRSAAAEANVEGNPNSPLSEPVRTFLDADVPEWQRFCSVTTWERQHRLLVTVDPSMDGRWRWHNGLIVRNFSPKPAEQAPACWEGMWTLPPLAAGIVQLVNGLFWGEERQFALCLGSDGVNRLAEFRSERKGEDVMPDGTRVPIRCQLLTRAVDFSTTFNEKAFLHGTLFVRNVTGDVEWAVWVRPHARSKFTYWRGGKISVSDSAGELSIEQAEPFTGPLPLGTFPKDCGTKQGVGRAFEFLIRWKGYAQIETLRIMANGADDAAEKLDVGLFNVAITDPLAGGYSDFEYSGPQEWGVTVENQ